MAGSGYGGALAGDIAMATGNGRRLGRYTLREKVGEGGMGVVWSAADPAGRLVAVKLLRPEVAADATSRARFAREVGTLERVRGPHIAAVLDADVQAATPYLVTEFVDGPSLAAVVTNHGPVSDHGLARLARELAEALRAIHAAGVVHRDLKPSNVLLRDEGCVLIDFGIAQLADDVRLTLHGTVFGTPAYLAPELLEGRPVTTAADIHSLAATLCFAATGRPPFRGGHLAAIAYAVVHDPPDLSGAPGWATATLARCLAKSEADRPTAAQLLEWLAPPAAATVAVATSPGSAGGPSRPTAGAGGGPARVGDGGTRALPLLATGSGGSAPGPAGPAEPAAAVPAAAAPSAARSPSRAAGWAVGVLAALLLAAVAAAAPVVGLALLVGWMLVARTVETQAALLARRRAARGRRRVDGWVVAGVAPWHVARAAGHTAAAAAVAGAAGLLAAGLLAVGLHVGAVPVPVAGLLALAGLVAVAVAWWWPSAAPLRAGTLRVGRRLLARRRAALVGGVVLAFLVALVGSLAGALGPWAYPDWAWLRDVVGPVLRWVA